MGLSTHICIQAIDLSDTSPDQHPGYRPASAGKSPGSAGHRKCSPRRKRGTGILYFSRQGLGSRLLSRKSPRMRAVAGYPSRRHVVALHTVRCPGCQPGVISLLLCLLLLSPLSLTAQTPYPFTSAPALDAGEIAAWIARDQGLCEELAGKELRLHLMVDATGLVHSPRIEEIDGSIRRYTELHSPGPLSAAIPAYRHSLPIEVLLSFPLGVRSITVDGRTQYQVTVDGTTSAPIPEIFLTDQSLRAEEGSSSIYRTEIPPLLDRRRLFREFVPAWAERGPDGEAFASLIATFHVAPDGSHGRPVAVSFMSDTTWADWTLAIVEDLLREHTFHPATTAGEPVAALYPLSFSVAANGPDEGGGISIEIEDSKFEATIINREVIETVDPYALGSEAGGYIHTDVRTIRRPGSESESGSGSSDETGVSTADEDQARVLGIGAMESALHYPQPALDNLVEGEVHIYAWPDADGAIERTVIMHTSHPIFNAVVLDAVRHLTLDLPPTDPNRIAEVTVTFRLHQ